MSRNRATFKTTILIHKIHRALHSNIFVVITAGFPVIHPPPQETSIEILHDHENVINSVQTFLRKFNRYSFFETPKVLLLAWDRVFEIKDALGTTKNKLEDLQELFRKLSNDVQNIHKELAEYINTPGWNFPAFYDNDDDDDVDYTIAITPVLSTEEPVNSLSMGDEHLDTIPATESDEVIKSSVEDLVPFPKSILNHDSSIISSSSKIDSLLDEFAGKLTLLKSIPPGEEFNSENSNAEIESFSPSPIPNEDSDSFMEEIDLFLTPNDPMPPSIEDDEDSEGDILFERLLYNDPVPLPDIFEFSYELSSILRNLNTLAKGFYPPSLHFLSFN
nr:hypothetical protein [Tanacetum cinerariifolium]